MVAHFPQDPSKLLHMEQKDLWEKALTKRVGSEVKRLRDQPPKRSAQWLSDRTEELGMKISRARIADVEGTNRGGAIKVSELLVLARALEVSPGQLLFPDLPDGQVEVIPGVVAPSLQAVSWIYGYGSSDELSTDNGQLLRMSHELRDYQAMVRGRMEAQAAAAARLDHDEAEAAAAELAASESPEKAEYARLHQQMVAARKSEAEAAAVALEEQQRVIADLSQKIEAEKTGRVR